MPLLDPGRLCELVVLNETMRAELSVYKTSICGSELGELLATGRLKERRDSGLDSGVADIVLTVWKDGLHQCTMIGGLFGTRGWGADEVRVGEANGWEGGYSFMFV